MENDKILSLKNVCKSFDISGSKINVLKEINLDISEGEFVCIVGKSGCGKSTLLRLISGLEYCSDGEIYISGNKVNGPCLACGMIFQEARLFPWLRVKDNVAYGISESDRKSNSKKELSSLIRKYISLVNLDGFENAYPQQLSGGMQQRVSIARALIERPKVLLLDEPFGALDAITRMNMQNEILRIWREQKATMILVTHDIDEAIYLADRVIVLSNHPGEVKKSIPIELPRPRRRTGIDFSEMRRNIYIELFDEEDPIVEDYVI